MGRVLHKIESIVWNGTDRCHWSRSKMEVVCFSEDKLIVLGGKQLKPLVTVHVGIACSVGLIW